MRHKSFPLVLSTLMFLPLMPYASAQEREGGFYITPDIGYYFFDKDRNVENDPSLGLGLGYDFNAKWGVRIMGEWLELEPDRGRGDIDARYWHGDMLYHFGDFGGWRPYALLGAGDMRLEPDAGGHDRETVYNAGFGVKRILHDNIDLRMEAQGLYSGDNETWDGALHIGIEFLFGNRSTPAPEPVAVVEPPRDSDGDGVPDDRDQCPGTPAGVQVDERGCPLPPKDSDGDGVPDDRDQCPNTPRRAKVDARGCTLQLEETVTFQLNVQFELESARIQKQYLPEVEKLGRFLQEYPDTDVVLEGHTDSTGSERFNQELSEVRANTVRNHLIEYFEIDPERIRAVGYGESRPIADNSTPEGRYQNRRVVAVVSAKTLKDQMR